MSKTAQVWFIYQDSNGHYSVSQHPGAGIQVAGPFTWDGAVQWMQAHNVPGW